MCKILIAVVLVSFASLNYYSIGFCQNSQFQKEEVAQTNFSPKNEVKPKANAMDKIISSTLKVLAKTYVKTANLEDIKKKNIKKIERKSDEKFRVQFEKIYAEIKDTPLEEILDLSPMATKEDVVKRINKLTKKEFYKVIDSIPDYLIGQKVKEYFDSHNKDGSDKRTTVKDVKSLWNRIISKVTPSQ